MVFIHSIEAKWPCLVKKNKRYTKYCLAITLEADDAEALRDYMQSVHRKYLKKNPESAALPLAPFCEMQEDGLTKFELQNRQKPKLVSADRTDFEGTIGEKSIVNLIVKAVGYSNSRTGVSLRVNGVQVLKAVSKGDAVRELFERHMPGATKDEVGEVVKSGLDDFDDDMWVD